MARSRLVVANFISQLGWPWCLDTWSEIILPVSMGVFLDRICIEAGGLRVQWITLHNGSGIPRTKQKIDHIPEGNSAADSFLTSPTT